MLLVCRIRCQRYQLCLGLLLQELTPGKDLRWNEKHLKAKTCRLSLALGHFCQQSNVISSRQFADWPIVSNTIGLLVLPNILPYHYECEYVAFKRIPL